MKTYELILNEKTDDNGVFAISLVSDPAIESNWITLSKDIKMAIVDDDKQILMGAALIPDKLIPRKDKDGEFNVFFTKDTVEQVSQMFFKNGFQRETTLEHQIDLSENTVFESWIKVDDINDKSVKYGLDVPIGTWLISMKVEDADLYEMAKKGLINGFSIEGKFADMLVKNDTELSKNVTNNNNNSYNNMEENETLLSKIKALVSSKEVKEEIKKEVKVELKKDETYEAKVLELSKRVDSLKESFEKDKATLKADFEKLQLKNVELQKQLDEKPDANKIVHSPEVKEVELKTSKDRILFAIQKNK